MEEETRREGCAGEYLSRDGETIGNGWRESLRAVVKFSLGAKGNSACLLCMIALCRGQS